MGCAVSPFINSHGFGSCSISDAFLVFARAFCFFFGAAFFCFRWLGCVLVYEMDGWMMMDGWMNGGVELARLAWRWRF